MTRLLTAAAAALLVLTAACSPTTTSPSLTAAPSDVPTHTPDLITPAPGAAAPALPQPPTVDRQDPDAVATAALTALYSHDTATDRGPADAAGRALPLLSAAFARSVATAPPIAPADATWRTWARHRAIVTPRIAAGHDDQPAGSATVCYRQYTLTRQPRGRDGWHGTSTRSTLFLRLTHDATGWAVDQVLPR